MYTSLNATSRKDALRSALDGIALSDGAKSWLIQNIDPFHDHQFQMAAPPTPSLVDSVVQCRRLRVNLQATESGTLSLFVPPVPFAATVGWAENAASGQAPTRAWADYGGLMVSTDGLKYETVAALDDITDGPNRIIGMGWEVINTTPEMYKSGSILTYQCPWLPASTGAGGYDLVRGETGMVGVDGYTSGAMVTRTLQAAQVLPSPYDSTSATTLPSSKQWDAGHGVYCVPRLSQFDGPFSYQGVSGGDTLWKGIIDNTPGGFRMFSASPDKQYSKYRGGQVDPRGGQPCVLNATDWLSFYSQAGSASAGQPDLAYGSACLSGYTATGAHLTGLSPQSTFTVVLTYYV